MRTDLLYVSVGQRFGPRSVAINLLEKLLDFGHLTIRGVVDEAVAESIPMRHRRHIQVVKNAFGATISLLIASLRDKPKICHFNFPPINPFFLSTLLVMKISRVKVAYSFHGGILLENKSGIPRALFLLSCRHFYDVIVTNSRYSANLLLDFARAPWLQEKIKVIPNGINSAHALVARSGPISPHLKGEPSILFVGRLEYVKGVDVLIKAVRYAKACFPEICLHIVGVGSQIKEVRQLISCLDMEANVVLHGFIDNAKLDSFFSGAEIVAVPSRCETFGITVLEAMAFGKPLIVSNRGALPEIVKHLHNGLVVQLDPRAFADSIVLLHNNEQLRNEISENNERTISSYAWTKIAEEYVELYKHTQQSIAKRRTKACISAR